MFSRMKPGRYILAVLFLGVIFPTGLIFAVNCSVDPYYQWRFAPAYAKNIDLKYEMGLNGRISRAYQIRFYHPKHIVLGSSRCSIGIDENYKAWPEGRCYNLSVFGSGIDESLAFLRHAQRISPLDTVVLGLDLFSFNQTGPRLVPHYEDILSYRDYRFGWQFSRIRTAASVDTFKESWKRIRLGDSSAGNPGKSMPSNPRLFRIGVSMTVGRYFSADGSRFSFRDSQGGSSFEIYRQLLAFCHENGINLKLFVSPQHAVQLESIDGLGLWDAFETWKRGLAKINEETAAQFGKLPYPLWDFAGYNLITTETVPRQDDPQGRMNFFFDPNHYKHEVGNRILDSLLDGAHTPGFGERLTSDSIEEHLLRIRRDRVIWRDSRPDEHEEFWTLARNARPQDAIIDTSY